MKLPKIDPQGFPDCGCGVYSDELSYKDWFRFNLKVRAVRNTMETLTQVICWTLIGGLYYEWVAIAGAIVIFIGRIIFTIGYCVRPKLRFPGMILSTAGLMLVHSMCYVTIATMLVEMNPYLYA